MILKYDRSIILRFQSKLRKGPNLGEQSALNLDIKKTIFFLHAFFCIMPTLFALSLSQKIYQHLLSIIMNYCTLRSYLCVEHKQ